ncbi:hypothetical protein GW17_00052239 [Ensete ventricosum]|nr:hypothetical protein GW17_00052239 [Ensete ventricosum]RZS20282.1 hypothetical protein BHM03_00052776 [Ensete ventricosum]
MFYPPQIVRHCTRGTTVGTVSTLAWTNGAGVEKQSMAQRAPYMRPQLALLLPQLAKLQLGSSPFVPLSFYFWRILPCPATFSEKPAKRTHNLQKQLHPAASEAHGWLTTSGLVTDESSLPLLRKLLQACMALLDGAAYDNVAGIGCRFQEIVPLSARNVLGLEKSKISTKWNSLIGTTLNKSLPDHQVYHAEEGGYRRVSSGRKFRCIMSKQMVGIFVSLCVLRTMQGSVSLRFCLHETSFCFVCCHLASGGKQGDEMHRNADFMDILSRTCFRSGSSVDLPKKILDHE